MRCLLLGSLVCALTAGGCGESDGGETQRPCAASPTGCVCGSEQQPELNQCSELSLEGEALCCESSESDSCFCSELACGQRTDLDYCSCGLRSVVLSEGQTEVASCTGGGAVKCCLNGTGGIGGSSCRCTELDCSSDQTEVFTCDAESVKDCGTAEEVGACLLSVGPA